MTTPLSATATAAATAAAAGTPSPGRPIANSARRHDLVLTLARPVRSITESYGFGEIRGCRGAGNGRIRDLDATFRARRVAPSAAR
jgi:hypothetical protein